MVWNIPWILISVCLSCCGLQNRWLVQMQTSTFCKELDLKHLLKSQICSPIGLDAAYGT